VKQQHPTASNPAKLKNQANLGRPPQTSSTPKPVWIIEFLECGVWTTLDEADDEETALALCSIYCDVHGEDGIRISTPDHRLL
jgi:hypothetical protein